MIIKRIKRQRDQLVEIIINQRNIKAKRDIEENIQIDLVLDRDDQVKTLGLKLVLI